MGSNTFSFKNGLNWQGSAVDSECQAWAACTDSLTYKMMSEWAQSDVKRNLSINYTKNGNPKIPGIIVYPPNTTLENGEKYFGMGGDCTWVLWLRGLWFNHWATEVLEKNLKNWKFKGKWNYSFVGLVIWMQWLLLIRQPLSECQACTAQACDE